MSEIDRDLLPSREEDRPLKRALGSAIPEFIARFGAAGAIKRAEAELRRARRARSQKLYAFWSNVLAQIDPDKNESPSAVIDGAEPFRSPPGASIPRRPSAAQRRPPFAGASSRRSGSGHHRSGP